MSALDFASAALLALGLAFFVAGTVALVRFPDLYSRLHALTKADNVGLGLVVLALALEATSWQEVLKLAFIWVMVLLASACVGFLIAREARARGLECWRGDD
ncbi:MAG TPA: monovalent cation/H(+) antiporter subunit G [Thermoanaerobaculaceae bacterium]|nr:monovalent cation/H(+) antiporter subunit G [Thermoanaerobaculaceae bacterium]HRS16624.1 monovalent cation/H(+) antiporter subunit G [Thermoanaerobaculaceae bacterium]